MSLPHHPERARLRAEVRRKPRWAALMIGLGSLVPAAFLATIGSDVLVMASDGCVAADQKPICAPDNQELVAHLPGIGLGAGLLVGVLGGIAFAVLRKNTLWWVGAGWACLLVAVIAAVQIGAAGPSPEYLRREDAAQQRQDEEFLHYMRVRPDYPVVAQRYRDLQRDIAARLAPLRLREPWPLPTSLADRPFECGYATTLGTQAEQLLEHAGRYVVRSAEATQILDVVTRTVQDHGYRTPAQHARPGGYDAQFTGANGEAFDLYAAPGYATGTMTLTADFQTPCLLTEWGRGHLPH